MNRHLLAWIVPLAAALLLAACAPAVSSDATDEPPDLVTNTPDEPPTRTPIADSDLPTYYLIDAGGARIAGLPGSWCWGDNCVDLYAAPDPETFSPIGEQGLVVLEMDPPLPEKLLLTLLPAADRGAAIAETEMAPTELRAEWQVDVPPGQYVLVAFGSYDGGSADLSYFFGLATGDSLPPVAAPPALHLLVGGESLLDGLLGTYCWTAEPDGNGEAVGICVDAIWPPVHDTFTELPAGEPIQLVFEENPAAQMDLSLYDAAQLAADPQTPPVATLTVNAVQEPVEWSPEAPRGNYLLVVSARWPEDRNDATYSFGLSLP